MLGSTLPSYSAFAAEKQNTLNVYSQGYNVSLSENLIQTADQYVVVEENKFVLKDEKKLKEILSERDFEIVNNLVSQANNNLETISGANTAVVGNSVVVMPKDVSAKTISYAKASEGKRAIKFHWWGIELWLTKTDVRAIVKGGISGGAAYLGSIFGIAGAVAGAVVGAIISEYITGVPIYVKYTYGNKYPPIVLPQ